MCDLRERSKAKAGNAHINQPYNNRSYMENHLEKVALAAHGIAYMEGIKEEEALDFIYAVSMLHDYIEDCVEDDKPIILKEHEKLSKEFNPGIANAILILSENMYKSEDDYFKAIGENFITKVVKAADRITNVLSLPEVQVKKKRANLFNKYSEQVKYFEKYDIYPDLIKKALNEVSGRIK